jgi:progressive ankylosis protein
MPGKCQEPCFLQSSWVGSDGKSGMIETEPESLSYRKIFRFWLPLLAAWLMMAIEGPFLAAIIARMAGEQENLAAYGVAYAFGLVAESPVIMLMSASTALCRDRESYRRLRNFSLLLCLAVTLVLGLFLLPGIFDLVARQLIGLPPAVAELTHRALLCLLPWPAAIGIRRFYQGVLIAAHQTRRVAAGTCLRVVSMAGSALLLYRIGPLPGAEVGALALSAGVVAEALFTRFMVRHEIRRLGNLEPVQSAELVSYRVLWEYYLPLALTPFIGLSIHPLVTFFLGKSPQALESLAVMPVLYGLTFIFRAMGLSYQEVAIALLGENRAHYGKVRNFAAGLGVLTSLCLGLIAFTPLHQLWFEDVSGLSRELATFAVLPLQIMAVFPALTVLICFQRSVLIVRRSTRPISFATGVEALAIFALLLAAASYFSVPGAVSAAGAYVIGRLLAVAVLKRSMKFGGAKPEPL